jgi:hypothetical protein
MITKPSKELVRGGDGEGVGEGRREWVKASKVKVIKRSSERTVLDSENESQSESEE